MVWGEGGAEERGRVPELKCKRNQYPLFRGFGWRRENVEIKARNKRRRPKKYYRNLYTVIFFPVGKIRNFIVSRFKV